MKTVCIMCPMGCELTIEKHGTEISVSGNSCARGIEYGKAEITNPTRVVTSVISTDKEMVSVKTTKPVSKQKIAKILKIIANLHIKTAKSGEVLQKNIDGDGADLVVTGTWKK